VLLGSGLCLAVVLSACAAAPAVMMAHQSDPVAPVVVESSVVQSFHKQLRARDKRIEELKPQLNILKMIDQDVEVRRKPAPLPATLTPSE
jgi:hypothetical protein